MELPSRFVLPPVRWFECETVLSFTVSTPQDEYTFKQSIKQLKLISCGVLMNE